MKYQEFTKISPHNHFGGRYADYCFGDSPSMSRTFDLSSAQAKIDSANSFDFEMLGFTNHNHFWKSEYESLLQYILTKGYSINLLPGVEFDLKKNLSDTKRLHVVFLVSEDEDLGKFEATVDNLMNTNCQYAISIEQLVDLFFEFKCIIIPHGNKQKERGAIANSDSFSDLLGVHNFIPIMIENKTEAKKEYLLGRFRSMLTSETFDWLENSGSVSSADQDDFSAVVEPTFIWAPNTFDALFFCAIIGETRFFRESDIIKKNQFVSKLEIRNMGGELNDSTITFSHGLNSIIGNSGSGKTLLLNLINKTITNDNLKNSVSSSENNYDEVYKDSDIKLFDEKGNQIGLGSINIFEGESLYKQVVKTIGLNKNSLLKEFGALPSFQEAREIINNFNILANKYIKEKSAVIKNNQLVDESFRNYASSITYLRDNSLDKETIVFTIDPSIGEDYKKLSTRAEELESDLKETKESFEAIDKISKKYGLPSASDEIKTVQKQIERRIYKLTIANKKHMIACKATMLRAQKIFELVSNYNEKIGQRALSINNAKQTIANESQNIIDKLKENALLEKSLSTPYIDNSSIMDAVKEQKTIDLVKLDNFAINLQLDYDDIPVYFETSIGSSPWKINKSKFSLFKEKELDLTSPDSVEDFLSIFVKENYLGTIDMKFIDDGSFIKYDTLLRKENGEYKKIESMSAGELSKIYINLLIDMKLKKKGNSAVILYDQPDNNLEKEFILTTLVTKIVELKKKYQVIITTHEPLLVVNGDSNAIIKVTNNPVGGRNSISFENLNLYDSASRDDAIDKVSRIIDGDKKAVKLRNKIYGGLDAW